MDLDVVLDDENSRRRRRNRARRAVTVTTVAKAAGVSRAAVSFAYNAPEQLSTATRERILRTAADLGYTPDPVARMLTTREAGAIGLLMVEPIEAAFADPFTTTFVRGLGQMCDQHGLALTLLPPRMGSSAAAVRSAIVDGVIALGQAPDSPALIALEQRGLPLVIVDGPPDDRWASVQVDDEAGAYLAAQHLAALGHRRVAVLAFELRAADGEGAPLYVPAQRLAGYRRGLIEPPTVVELHSDATSGLEVMRRLLDTPEPPTAVLAMSDAMALGALLACVERGIRVPEEVSFIGFDDISESTFAAPPLTTVRQPIMDKATTAARLLLRELRREPGDDQPHASERLLTELVVRGSTAPAAR